MNRAVLGNAVRRGSEASRPKCPSCGRAHPGNRGDPTGDQGIRWFRPYGHRTPEGEACPAGLPAEIPHPRNGPIEHARPYSKERDQTEDLGLPIHHKTRVGIRIKSLRIERDMTQVHLASEADMTRENLVRLESGLGRPNLDTLARVCDAMGVTLAEFFSF